MDIQSKSLTNSICPVIVTWHSDITPDGSDFCTLLGVKAGFDTMTDLPIETTDDRRYWAQVCQETAGLTHFWSLDDAIAHDHETLEKYTPCPDCGVVGCLECAEVAHG